MANRNAPLSQPQHGGLVEASFQHRVQPWMMECFGEEIAADVLERNDRFIEEALELVQANCYTADRAHALVDYVFGRPVGEPAQEVGGVMVTLAALCLAAGLDMHDAGEIELARISQPDIIKKIRAKQAAKPTGSALPIASNSPVVGEDARVLTNPPQVPPFLSAPTFDDRAEDRVCINGCLYLRADYAAKRYAKPTPTDTADRRGAIARLLCNEPLARHIAAQDNAPSFDDSSDEVQAYWRALASAVVPLIAGLPEGDEA